MGFCWSLQEFQCLFPSDGQPCRSQGVTRSDFHFQKVIPLQGSKCLEGDMTGRRSYGPELMEGRHGEERGQDLEISGSGHRWGGPAGYGGAWLRHVRQGLKGKESCFCSGFLNGNSSFKEEDRHLTRPEFPVCMCVVGGASQTIHSAQRSIWMPV